MRSLVLLKEDDKRNIYYENGAEAINPPLFEEFIKLNKRNIFL